MNELKSRILELLASTPCLTDRQVTDILLGKDAPQQTVNIICRQLKNAGVIGREKVLGSHIQNRLMSNRPTFESKPERPSAVAPLVLSVNTEPNTKLIEDPDALIANYVIIAGIAGLELTASHVDYEYLPAPHKRPRLPARKMAVYVFEAGGKCLKVGKVGPKSHARFTSQHYLPNSAKSNLARSILSMARHGKVPSPGISIFTDSWSVLDDLTVSEWLLTNTSRHHFYLNSDLHSSALSLLESFLHCRLKPMFEG
jgi:hypothetical protein